MPVIRFTRDHHRDGERAGVAQGLETIGLGGKPLGTLGAAELDEVALDRALSPIALVDAAARNGPELAQFERRAGGIPDAGFNEVRRHGGHGPRRWRRITSYNVCYTKLLRYLVGEREFYGRCFHVDERVLIPRPETELIIDLALAAYPTPPARVLDLGTGSGALAVTLSLEWPAAEVFV